MQSLLEMAWDYIHSIPNVVWSGVIASFITLSGVFLSNKSNAKQLLTQLQHDSVEKDRARAFDLRKAIYLSTINEIMKFNDVLNNLVNEDILELNLSDKFNGFYAACYQLEIAAEPKTTELLYKLSRSYSHLQYRVFELLLKAREAKNELDIQEQFQEAAKDRCYGAIQEMRVLSASSNFNQTLYDHLSNVVATEQKNMKSINEEQIRALSKFSDSKLAFQLKLNDEIKNLGIKELKSWLVSSMREDLGFKEHFVEPFEEKMTCTQQEVK